MSISTRIRRKREDRHYSQEYMAEKLGISQNAYSCLETGKTKVDLDRLQQIAEILEEPLESFLNGDHIVINNENQHGPNGYHVVQHQQIPVEFFERLFTSLADIMKEQQRQNTLIIQMMDKDRNG